MLDAPREDSLTLQVHILQHPSGATRWNIIVATSLPCVVP